MARRFQVNANNLPGLLPFVRYDAISKHQTDSGVVFCGLGKLGALQSCYFRQAP